DALVHSKNVITVDLAMQLNIGRVMNLAARAGMPKVDRAYPSMALGTAEATPLQVASAYTMFANLGDRVAPLPITQVTAGDGRVIASPTAERKNIVRPDVAYIVDDILKDVINRGTAAQAQGWGFRNVPGKTAFAGKTGTSRDGWFAGFTPDLVCVVYVGFDNGDDLGMTGADSAMPIWADFMKEALARNPDWNGDWAMPASVKKAEIDIRDGSVLKEMDPAEVLNAYDQDNAAKRKPGPDASATPEAALPDGETTDPAAAEKNVPPEFRRTELFVAGTIPLKNMPDPNSDLPPEDLPPDQPDQQDAPTPSPTPVSGTWQDKVEPPNNKSTDQRLKSQSNDSGMVTVMICPVTGMRATANCPERVAQKFKAGTEPKDFCTFHR
ncbi:MAG: penicillin-binding transpeptidase domain-containing protein, partial [Pyrinomonadaceae bacterium]